MIKRFEVIIGSDLLLYVEADQCFDEENPQEYTLAIYSIKIHDEEGEELISYFNEKALLEIEQSYRTKVN
jgi:hypothetical protein